MSGQKDFYVTGGAVRLGAPCYVTRPADDELYTALAGGEFCYVLTSRQMGKTSLMIRAARRLQQSGHRVAMLDLTATGLNVTAEQWYGSLLVQLGERLGLADELLGGWEADAGWSPLQRFTRALRRLLTLDEQPLVIFVDEIDAVRGLTIAVDEFFAAIREFYNRRADDPLYHRLTFCLLGVATPSDLIRNPLVTPFNVGRRVELRDFTVAEARGLAAGFGLPQGPGSFGRDLAADLLRRVFYWTGGQPYLTQQLCRAIAADSSRRGRPPARPDVDRLCQELFLSPEGQSRDHNLLFVRDRLLHSDTDPAALLEQCQRLWRGKPVPDDERDPVGSALKLAGLVRVTGGFLRIRNRIYRQVFNLSWIRSHMPDAELRRQQQAFRQGVTRAALVAAIVLFALLGLVGWALLEKGHAERNARIAYQAQQQALTDRNQAQRSAHQAQAAEVRSGRLANERLTALAQARTAYGAAERARRRAEDASSRETMQRNRAMRQSHLALTQRDTARRLLYAANIELAAEAAQRYDAERVLELLLPLREPAQQVNFEWRLLWQLCHQETLRLSHVAQSEQAAAFSPDGRYLLTALDDQTVSVADAATYRRRRLLSDSLAPLAVSPDSSRLATATPGGEVQVRELTTGALLYRLPAGSGRPRALSFSPDGRRLAISNEHGRAQVWNIAERAPTFTLPSDGRGVQWLGYSPDGELIAAVDSQDPDHGVLRLFRASDGHAITVLPVPAFHVPWTTQAFTRDGRSLVLAHSEHVVLLDLKSHRSVRDFVHPARVTALTVAQENLLATAATDRVVRIWDLETGRVRRSLMGLRRPATTLAFSPDRRFLLASGDEGLLRVWPVQDEQDQSSRFGATGDWCQAVDFSPDGRWLACTWQKHGLWVRDRWTGLPRLLDADATMLHGMCFSPDGKFLAAAVRRRPSGNPGSVDVYETTTWRRTLHAQFSPSHVAFSPNSRLLAATGFRVPTDEVHLWSMPSGRPLPPLSGRTWVAFSPVGDYLATANGLETQIFVYHIASRKVAAILPAKASYGVFSPDGRRLAYQDIPGTVGAFDLQSHRLAFQTAVGTGGGRLAFSPDGSRLLCGGGMMGSFKVLEAASGRELLSWAAPPFVNDALLAPDGRSLAIAHGQGLRVLPVPTAGEISTWEAQEAPDQHSGARSGQTAQLQQTVH